MSWETVIGLEIHAQLSTKSKLFSGGSTKFGAESNTHVDLVDMGLPGVLPVANKEAFFKAIRFGLATGAEINQISSFDRKNYFYPDLPKGYQITQMTQPIVDKGSIKILVDDYEKEINITRAHLEEDAGKSIHDMFEGETGVDLNRAGTPLLEIVSEPEISSAKEAVAYFKAIRQLVTFLDICDGNMAQGSMRCDVNVSIKKSGDKELGTRAELKNINSFMGINEGIQNTNYKIKLDLKDFILTIYENIDNENDLKFFLNLMNHLSSKGIKCPIPLKNSSSKMIGKIKDKPAALLTFLGGKSITQIREIHTYQIGIALAELHLGGEKFKQKKRNELSIYGWQKLLINEL